MTGPAPVLYWQDIRWKEVRERFALCDFWRNAADRNTELAINSTDPDERDRQIRKAQEHIRFSQDELAAALVLLRGPGKNEVRVPATGDVRVTGVGAL